MQSKNSKRERREKAHLARVRQQLEQRGLSTEEAQRIAENDATLRNLRKMEAIAKKLTVTEALGPAGREVAVTIWKALRSIPK